MLIAQITDTHITREGEEQRYLSEAIDFIATMQPRPDVVLLTGDTTNNGTFEQYGKLAEILARSAVPIYLVPGNHDAREPLRAALPQTYYPGATGERMHFAVEAFPVRLIGLDTAIERWPGGVFPHADLAWLEATLDSAPERPALIFMHHPPFRTGVNAADIFGFRGLRALTETIVRRPMVRRLIAGHIHCERRATLGTAVASTALSTMPQHVPEVLERKLLGMRAEPAGFAVHAWGSDAFTTTGYVNTGNGRFAIGRVR